MRSSAAVAATAAAVGTASYFLWKHRERIKILVLPPPAQPPPAEDEDACAICLERPQEAVKTQCNHRFCLGCFRSWASRQVPPSSTARCPLCTSTVVRLTPETWPGASVESLSRTRWLITYNLEAALSVKLAWASRALEAVRSASGSLAVVLYVISGQAWESAVEAMRFSFAPVPPPADVRLRASARWIVSAHVLWAVQRVMHPPDDPRQVQLGELLAWLRPLALSAMAFSRDMRHAAILRSPPEHASPAPAPSSAPSSSLALGARTGGIPSGAGARGAPAPAPPANPPALSAMAPISDAVASAAVTGGVSGGETSALAAAVSAARSPRSLRDALAALLPAPPPVASAARICEGVYTVSTLLRLVRTVCLTAHAAAPEAARAHPLVLRALDAAITICELVGVVMHMRIELVGLRGLLLLLQWTDERAPTVHRVRPHESGLWARRYCEVEELHASYPTYAGPRTAPLITQQRRGLRWEEALEELAVPLRALYAFYGARGLRARGFPAWAVADVRAMRLPEDVP